VKYILAISGGVDSVVLLDMVAKGELSLQAPSLQINEVKPLQAPSLQKNDIIVAHFNHGIRQNSADDAELVKNLAAKYQIKCVVGREQLGKNASEATARAKRYEFLRSLSQNGASKIVTAHHQDDLVETIVMNLVRGTGWRGLAPFWSDDICRPLLNMTKAEIIAYAVKHNLTWTEDETNYSAGYFRNRVRDMITGWSPQNRQHWLLLGERQQNLRAVIEAELASFAKVHRLNRYFLIMIPAKVALEVLKVATDKRLTASQLELLLNFAKTAQVDKKLEFKDIKVVAKKKMIDIKFSPKT
jgi:tRNA(Ile)-lysidine synthetase-like protein